MNLASLFNLSGNEAKDALVTAPRRVIMHAGRWCGREGELGELT